MITGQGSALQLGQESTWGTAVSPTVAINHTSESFKLAVDRSEEDSLVGGATTRDMDIMKKSVNFDFDLLAKPENIGFILGCALGVESTPVEEGSGFKHSFTMLKPGVSASLPKFTAIVDRHVACKAYTGCKIGNININAQAGDYMRMTVSGIGKDEIIGTSYKSDDLDIPALKAFRFAGGTCTFDGVTYGDITNVQFALNNNLDDGAQTLGSGYYGTEAEPQARDVTISLDCLYNATSETIREQKYKTENKVAVVLNFESPSEIASGEHYTLAIKMPLVVINEADPVISGKEKITLTLGGKATESKATEAVTIELVDSIEDKYTA